MHFTPDVRKFMRDVVLRRLLPGFEIPKRRGRPTKTIITGEP